MNLEKAFQFVTLVTDIRSLHKLYEAMLRRESGAFLTIDDDAQLRRLFETIEAVLVRSGYMDEREVKLLRAVRVPYGVRDAITR